MREPTGKHDDIRANLWAPLSLLCFGLAILGFLIAIERGNWFPIRPASGAAAAMAYAATPGGDHPADARHARPVPTR